ncbi:hypothetical protein BDP55DRAFT_769823 [Colletotrichum godetiae]|uniref:Uncharacterized protein n=1 Tax=Colletotrichum godetiae TaxID=1209918 RepID=A0AAJ0EWB7_9PEZI|nr:uncharacterized protein BDP55DRAFT_769823 [Colletotrichum godetiae]KAK1674034.1 hypothetical protein BDP55DRAFT_769823 [Colletotrichum godetiae]
MQTLSRNLSKTEESFLGKTSRHIKRFCTLLTIYLLSIIFLHANDVDLNVEMKSVREYSRNIAIHRYSRVMIDIILNPSNL